MQSPTLDEAVVSANLIARLSHPLAAANHRQWVRWESSVLRDPDRLTPDNAEAIIREAMAHGISKVFETDAEIVIGIVRGFVRTFAYQPDYGILAARKEQQFAEWVRYAVTKGPEDRLRWLKQCRTGFLHLPPQMQKSDYAEAETDLMLIAESGGLVLERGWRARMSPQTPHHLRRLRASHGIGIHGMYRTSEAFWSFTCVGCHASWSAAF